MLNFVTISLSSLIHRALSTFPMAAKRHYSMNKFSKAGDAMSKNSLHVFIQYLQRRNRCKF